MESDLTEKQRREALVADINEKLSKALPRALFLRLDKDFYPLEMQKTHKYFNPTLPKESGVIDFVRRPYSPTKYPDEAIF
jgi:hypothetical protein